MFCCLTLFQLLFWTFTQTSMVHFHSLPSAISSLPISSHPKNVCRLVPNARSKHQEQ
jgi:hypothetical protein